MRRYRTGLWSNSDFVKLWLGQTVSQFGSGITGLARAFALGTIPLAALLGVLGIGQLYIVAALAGMLTVIFTVAHSAYLPSLIPQESLVEANSKLAMSDALAEISGPAVAGSLVQLISAPFALLFDALSFLFSACCLGFIRTPEPALPAIEQRKSIWFDLVEGLRLVIKNPLLRVLAGSAGVFSLFGNFIGALYALYVIRQVGAPPIFLGLLVATGGVSAFVGAIMAERVVLRFGLGRTVGMGLSIYFIAEVSLRQSIVPANALGRTNAGIQFLSQGFAPLGALLAGILGGLIGLRLTILIGMLGVMLAGTWLLLSPVRKA
jgi:Na+/melibiose symporter-like transporter